MQTIKQVKFIVFKFKYPFTIRGKLHTQIIFRKRSSLLKLITLDYGTRRKNYHYQKYIVEK